MITRLSFRYFTIVCLDSHNRPQKYSHFSRYQFEFLEVGTFSFKLTLFADWTQVRLLKFSFAVEGNLKSANLFGRVQLYLCVRRVANCPPSATPSPPARRPGPRWRDATAVKGFPLPRIIAPESREGPEVIESRVPRVPRRARTPTWTAGPCSAADSGA